MRFNPIAYGADVAAILALDSNGQRLMPLASGQCSSEEARRILGASNAKDLFRESRAPEAALSGLWLYFSCLNESHSLSQDINTPEGSFWHGILHRQEPDPGNSAYWFRRVGIHPVFPDLLDESARILAEHPSLTSFKLTNTWDPFAFIEFCEQARREPGSEAEETAMRMQRAEWQLLFDHCARPAEAVRP